MIPSGRRWSPPSCASERQTLIRSAATGQWKTRQETAFYAASVMLPAETFASAIRNHWAIDNKNHPDYAETSASFRSL